MPRHRGELSGALNLDDLEGPWILCASASQMVNLNARLQGRYSQE